MSERRELTNDERQALQGLLPFTRGATTTFTPKYFLSKNENDEFQIPEDYRPVFTLKSLDKEEYNKAVKIQLDIGKGMSTLLEKKIGVQDICQRGVTDWKNLFDISDMTEVVYDNTEFTFGRIPWPILMEIFYQLLRISCLMPSEKLGLK